MRKPGTGMLKEYMDNPMYDIAGSYVIGDRETDAQLAANLGCKALILGKNGMTWNKISELLFAGERRAKISRMTKETDIAIEINMDGTGKCKIDTGLGFFDHMLEQIGRHGMMDLNISCKGDLNVDEHHTIEDTAIVLGQCIDKCLGSKRLPAYGRLPVPGGAGLWRTRVAKLGCGIPSREDWRCAYRDVHALL